MKKVLASVLSALSIFSIGLSSYVWSQFHVQTQVQNLRFPRNLSTRLDIFITTAESTDVQVGVCSGVIIKDGYVLTAAHCLPDERSKVKVDGKVAEVLKRDTDADLMLLKIEGVKCSPKCSPIAIKNAVTDTKVVTIGEPLGFRQVATEGRIEGIGKGKAKMYTLITSPIVFGNSGGGVFTVVDGKWVLVGIVSQINSADIGFFGVPVYHLGIAINAETITEFLSGTGY